MFIGAEIEDMNHVRNTERWTDHRAGTQKMLVFALGGSPCQLDFGFLVTPLIPSFVIVKWRINNTYLQRGGSNGIKSTRFFTNWK